MRSTLLLSVLAIGVVGCGDHGLPGGDMAMGEDMSANADMTSTDMSIQGDAAVYVTFTMFATDLAQAICAHEMMCGRLDAAQMAACVERNTPHTGWNQDVEITKGHLEINELQCLAAVQSSACDGSDSAARFSKCLQFLYVPHVASGSPCVANEECVAGYYCQHVGSDAGMPSQVTGCPGTCVPVQGTNQPCRLSTDCASDSYCDDITTHTCLKLSAAAAACTNLFGNGSGPPCQFGLTCPSFAASPTCVTPTTQMTVGGACDPFQGQQAPVLPCAPGMYCQVQYTATTTACTGAPGDCGAILGGYCNTTSGFCQKPSGGKCENRVASGAQCDPNNEGFFSFAESQCVDGTTCYKAGTQTVTTCQAFGSANANCTTDGNCKTGLYCSGGKCTPWIADAQACTSSSMFECAAGPNCVADNADAGTFTTCQQQKNAGAACNPGFEDALCANADLVGTSYCQPSGASGVCAPKCF